jgi:AraC-like DNA-binding protein
MKAQLESIRSDSNSSFRVLLTPRLNRQFYWHYHPEYEIVYIVGTNGMRHIGDHITRYTDSDLAFIGPNIPHLNFDYDANEVHEKVVIQLREDFLGTSFLAAPELASIKSLFERARTGLVFGETTKERVGQKLLYLTTVRGFEQLMVLLEVFKILSESTDTTPLSIQPLASAQAFREQERLMKVYHFVEQHYAQPIDFQSILAVVHLSDAAFCRYFKRLTGLTFTAFLNQYRISKAKQFLLQGQSVSEACFQSGFENLSYFNRKFRALTGENPLQFKKRAVVPSVFQPISPNNYSATQL